ncbi:MAG: DUF2304 domain-containing protein [Candidatus Acidiferrales bacterium]
MTLFHLNVFQLIVLPLVALLFVRSIVLLGRANRRRAAAIWSIIWVAAGITILRPGTTIWVAQRLGIGRGTDLVLYIFVIAFLIVGFYFFNRLLKLESALTEIVRQLAIREPIEQPSRPQTRGKSDFAATNQTRR